MVLAAAAVLAVLALLAAVEGGLRRWRPHPCPGAAASERMACLHRYSAVYGWELRPGVRLPFADGHITVDGQGRRASSSPPPADPRTRVVSLGDSVAFGLDVDDAATLAQQLRRLDPEREVVDLSVPGYGTDQELLKLEREGLSVRPTAVVLNFTLANDLADNALPAFLYDERHPKPYFRVESGELRLQDAHVRLPVRARTARWLSERSVLFNLLARGQAPAAAGAQGTEEAPVHWLTRYNEVMARPEPLLDLAGRLVGRMAEAAQAGGARLVVVAHPTRRSFADPSASLEPALRARLGSSVAFVSLAERYRARGLAYADLTTDGLGHLNARGHRAAAEAVHELLGASGPR